MEKQFVCILCPRGGRITVDESGNISGNFCKRGAGYVETELTSPTRTVTTTVRAICGNQPRISVKTDKPVPKSMIMEVMAEINKACIDKPMEIGDVIIENILNTGSNIVLTKPCIK